MAAKLTPLDKAVRAAAKKLPFAPRKQQNELLEYAADDLADAYRIGAEEAQGEIVARLLELRKAEDTKEAAGG